MLIRNKSFYMFADAIAVVVSFILALLGQICFSGCRGLPAGKLVRLYFDAFYLHCGYFILSAGPAYNEAKPME